MRRVSEIISPKCKTNAERTTFRANYRHFRISFAAHAFFHDRGASRVSSSFFFFSYIYIYIYIFVTPLGDSRDLSIPRASDKRIRLPHIRICSWNIHSRGYQRAVARMSLQRSPVIALVCFSGRWQRLNVSNTGNPLRRTYFAHATRAQAFVATAIYANRIRLPYSATQERTTTRSAAICCQLNPRDALNLRNKLFLLSRLLRSLPSTFLPTCRSHVVECAVEMRFA